MRKIITTLITVIVSMTIMLGTSLASEIDVKTVAKKPPFKYRSICKLFLAYPSWYQAALAEEKKWGVPVSTVMAIIHQESHFRQTARPPPHGEGHLLPSTAYGYAQAIVSTWHVYQEETGNKTARRDNFADAVSFIGWYANQAETRDGINKQNAYELYLSYYEGISGYYRGFYRKQPWIKLISRKVQLLSWIYKEELKHCKGLTPLPGEADKPGDIEKSLELNVLLDSMPDKSWWQI